jgi:hypothetical protein
MPPALSHWPDQSGYFVSSCAHAAAVKNIVASATAAIDLGQIILSSSDDDGRIDSGEGRRNFSD